MIFVLTGRTVVNVLQIDMNHEIAKPLTRAALKLARQPHKSICHAIEMKYYLAPLASNQRIPLPRFELNGTYIDREYSNS